MHTKRNHIKSRRPTTANIPDDIFISKPQNGGNKGKVAILTADGTEDQEFFSPYYRLLGEGYQVDVFTPEGKGFKGKNGAGLSKTMKVEDADEAQYAMLVIPGGKAPASLKKDEESVAFVRDFCATGKPIAAICHGPQILAAADVIKGKKIAAYQGCQEEVEEAGATYQDQECVTDGQFVTARLPMDIPAWMNGVMSALQSAGGQQRKAA